MRESLSPTKETQRFKLGHARKVYFENADHHTQSAKRANQTTMTKPIAMLKLSLVLRVGDVLRSCYRWTH